jgi:predicted RNA binding protein YcfA (HicA-like mRNA interferase family)
LNKLPVVSGREIVRVLTKIGFAIVGRKGSHVRLKRRRGEEVLIVIVPMHHELARAP